MVVEGIVKLRPLYAARRKVPGAALRPLVWVLPGFTTNGSTSGPIDRKRPHGRRKVPIGGILVANSRVNERRGREGRRCSSGWGTATSVAERVPEQRAPGEGGGWERGRVSWPEQRKHELTFGRLSLEGERRGKWTKWIRRSEERLVVQGFEKWSCRGGDRPGLSGGRSWWREKRELRRRKDVGGGRGRYGTASAAAQITAHDNGP
uniref:Uncharacterized protein n=1 Tax=Oryza nivara TaxID=4536 RepID=A0A0E0GYC5_ORYNI